MKKKYISFDIEASGPTPGKYSMLSIGACLVDDLSVTFYRELKPISDEFVLSGLKIGCLGLDCLKKYLDKDEYNPSHKNFNPEKTLLLLKRCGDEPSKVMSEYNDWILENTKGFKPVEVAAPIKFDSMFSSYYFDNFFSGPNPLGYWGDDIGSMYRGVMKNTAASINDIELDEINAFKHNALEDAIYQAKKFRVILDMMKNSN